MGVFLDKLSGATGGTTWNETFADTQQKTYEEMAQLLQVQVASSFLAKTFAFESPGVRANHSRRLTGHFSSKCRVALAYQAQVKLPVRPVQTTTSATSAAGVA